jgi:hypothetical protein
MRRSCAILYGEELGCPIPLKKRVIKGIVTATALKKDRKNGFINYVSRIMVQKYDQCRSKLNLS